MELQFQLVFPLVDAFGHRSPLDSCTFCQSCLPSLKKVKHCEWDQPGEKWNLPKSTFDIEFETTLAPGTMAGCPSGGAWYSVLQLPFTEISL